MEISKIEQTSQAFEQQILQTNAGRVRVSLLPEMQIPEIYKVVQPAALDKKQRERPFAADEFPSLDIFEEYASSGFIVGFTGADNDELVAYGFMTPSFFHRCPNPLYCDLRIFLNGSQNSTNLLTDLFECLVEFAKSLGYWACVIDTFTSCLGTIEAAHANGFQIRTYMPLSGLVPGQGLSETVVMFKTLSTEPMPNPNDPSIAHLPESRIRPMKRKTPPLSLPVQGKLSDGTPVVITFTEEKDIPKIQEIFDQAVRRGQGFSAAEAPPTEVLQAICRGEDPGYAFTLSCHGVPVGIFYTTPNLNCRSYDAALNDVYLIVDQDFSGKGVGRFCGQWWLWVSHQLGYKGCMSDTYLSNTPILRIIRGIKMRLVGSTRNGGYLEGKGWSDTVLFFKELIDGDSCYPELAKI